MQLNSQKAAEPSSCPFSSRWTTLASHPSCTPFWQWYQQVSPNIKDRQTHCGYGPELLQPVSIWESTKAPDQHSDMKGAANPLQKFLMILKDELKKKNQFIYVLSNQKAKVAACDTFALLTSQGLLGGSRSGERYSFEFKCKKVNWRWKINCPDFKAAMSFPDRIGLFVAWLQAAKARGMLLDHLSLFATCCSFQSPWIWAAWWQDTAPINLYFPRMALHLHMRIAAIYWKLVLAAGTVLRNVSIYSFHVDSQVCIYSSNSHNNLIKELLLLFPFYRKENQATVARKSQH